MYAMAVIMPKGPQALTKELRTLTNDGKFWLYLDEEAITYLRKIANVQEVSNLLEIQYGNVRILAGRHTTDWWRVYSIAGDVLFNEASYPEYVVFMKG